MAAIVEQNNDEDGIIWPVSVAPYQVGIVLINEKDDVQATKAEELYQMLTDLGYDVLLDDRDERPGVKFKDMDLIGLPIRITIGKKIHDNMVEWKNRKTKESFDLSFDKVEKKIKELI